MLHELTADEIDKLRATFLEAYTDLMRCCERHGLTVMLIGGSVIGAVRHQGFIPWDDDLDVAMPRADFETLKRVFDDELGDRYVLSSPNHKGDARNRFPMMLVKDTLLVEAGGSPQDEASRIKLDIFIIENVPDNPLARIAKGLRCTALMAMGSLEDTYEHRDGSLRDYMCKTDAGRRAFERRVRLGRLLSFRSFQQWMDAIDTACQYGKATSLMGIPTGRGHYFGEIRPAATFLPSSRGAFEGLEVDLPGDPDSYLRNLYGPDYMTVPPVEERERHFILDIRFKED